MCANGVEMLLPVAGQLFWKDHVRHRLIALVSSGKALVICPGKAPSSYIFISHSRKGESINLEEN
ncbi:MAG: hypothetical protein PVH48_04750 [Cyclobacteriaceae bacterium]